MSLQDFQLYLAIAKDVFTIIASTIAGVVAIVGLRTWRKQLKGKTEYELAQKLLIAIYKVRDAIYLVRNPLMSAGEISQAMKDANIEGNILDTNSKVNASSMQAVYQQRWAKLQEALNNMDVGILEAEALWDQDITDLAKSLNKRIMNLRVNIQKHLRTLQDRKEFNPKQLEEIDDIIYGFQGDKDQNKFSAEILECIEKFEKFLKPKLIR